MEEAESHFASAKNWIELWPWLFVQDIERSISFYCDRLGFQLVCTAEFGGKVCWCRLSRKG